MPFDHFEITGILELFDHPTAFLRVAKIDDNGSHIADVRVDGVPQHEHFYNRYEKGKEERLRIAQDVQHFLVCDVSYALPCG